MSSSAARTPTTTEKPPRSPRAGGADVARGAATRYDHSGARGLEESSRRSRAPHADGRGNSPTTPTVGTKGLAPSGSPAIHNLRVFLGCRRSLGRIRLFKDRQRFALGPSPPAAAVQRVTTSSNLAAVIPPAYWTFVYATAPCRFAYRFVSPCGTATKTLISPGVTPPRRALPTSGQQQ